MTHVHWAYLFFAALGMAAFWRLRPGTAVLLCVFGGWAALPVGQYPPFWPGQEGSEFPYWIIGLGLPSDMLLTKAWVCPVVAAIGVLLFDFNSIKRFRPAWPDVIPVVWCLSPFSAALAGRTSDPAPWIGALYLSASWGLPWLLGRLYFSTPDGLKQLARAVVLSAVIYLPICLIEGIWQPGVYGWIYEVHPFRTDGMQRYIGYRPIGFLEHGNQLGMWLAGAAVVAIWSAMVLPRPSASNRQQYVLAAVLGLLCLASQSAGAIILAVASLGLLQLFRWVRPRNTLLAVAIVGALGFGTYASGVIPIRKLAESNPVAQRLKAGLSSAGRGSLGWRMAQDERHLKTAYRHVFLGHGEWDWWREGQGRPWGMWLMIVGQFGILGLLSSTAIWIYPAGRALWSMSRIAVVSPQGVIPAALAIVLLITFADSLLNSFVILPLLLIAGGMAVPPGPLPNLPSGPVRLPLRQGSEAGSGPP